MFKVGDEVIVIKNLMNHSKTISNKIETAIVLGLRPHFLAVVPEEEFIHVIVSHPSFNIKSVASRVRIVFNLIRTYDASIFKEASIIVEAFDSEQIVDLLDSVL